MKTTAIDKTKLAELCALIEQRLAALPRVDWRDDAGRRAHDAELDRIFADLATGHGAKTGHDWQGGRIALAGIRSTSTGGVHGALTNWMWAARLRIQRAEELERAVAP